MSLKSRIFLIPYLTVACKHLIAIGTPVSEKSKVLVFISMVPCVALNQKDKGRRQKVLFFTLVGTNCPFIQ